MQHDGDTKGMRLAKKQLNHPGDLVIQSSAAQWVLLFERIDDLGVPPDFLSSRGDSPPRTRAVLELFKPDPAHAT